MKKTSIAWFAGALHSDGYVYAKKDKIREIRLRAAGCSIQMVEKWCNIINEITQKEHQVRKERLWDKRFSRYSIQYCVREASKPSMKKIETALKKTGFGLFEGEFNDLTEGVFAAYFAGILDGDGCVQIRNRSDGYGQELLLKIVSQNREAIEKIRENLEKFGQPKGYVTAYANHYDFWLYVNKNLFKWLKRKVISNLAITKKSRKLLLGGSLNKIPLGLSNVSNSTEGVKKV